MRVVVEGTVLAPMAPLLRLAVDELDLTHARVRE
jgi:hypothetical protein